MQTQADSPLNNTYRGYDYGKALIGGLEGFYWRDEDDNLHGAFPTDDAAMDDIGRYRRSLRAKREA